MRLFCFSVRLFCFSLFRLGFLVSSFDAPPGDGVFRPCGRRLQADGKDEEVREFEQGAEGQQYGDGVVDVVGDEAEAGAERMMVSRLVDADFDVASRARQRGVHAERADGEEDEMFEGGHGMCLCGVWRIGSVHEHHGYCVHWLDRFLE